MTLMPGICLVGVESSNFCVLTPRITTAFDTMDDIAWYGSDYIHPHTVLQSIFGLIYQDIRINWIRFLSISVFNHCKST
jgi:hypothetical protein